MISNQFTLLALSALTLVTAQSNSTMTIDPNTVEPLMRSQWCGSQQDSCTTLCGAVAVNECIRATLVYTCQCQGGKTPSLDEYKQTIPYFICDKLLSDCVAANAMDADAQKKCRTTYQCGTEDVNDHKGEYGPQPTSTSATSTTGPKATQTTEPETTTSDSAAAATAHAIGNGAAAVALGLLAYAL